MELTNLRNYVEEKKQWYLDKYGKLDWQWYDEGLVWAIQDYISMRGEFSKEDLKLLEEEGFSPEFFLEED